MKDNNSYIAGSVDPNPFESHHNNSTHDSARNQQPSSLTNASDNKAVLKGKQFDRQTKVAKTKIKTISRKILNSFYRYLSSIFRTRSRQIKLGRFIGTPDAGAKQVVLECQVTDYLVLKSFQYRLEMEEPPNNQSESEIDKIKAEAPIGVNG
jgi:hypothetical protein